MRMMRQVVGLRRCDLCLLVLARVACGIGECHWGASLFGWPATSLSEMRQAYQNKRTRGRSRKSPNPLSKSYESNGPDVKIRGTAAHIAEKYTTLARDAQSAGDTIQAENYMQHAEHYLRIIAAAQPQQQPAAERGELDESVADGEEMSADGALDVLDMPERPERGERPDRNERSERGDRGDRRRQQNGRGDGRGEGRGGRHRRSPYRNGMNGNADGDAAFPANQPQPFVDAMLPKSTNAPIEPPLRDGQATRIETGSAANPSREGSPDVMGSSSSHSEAYGAMSAPAPAVDVTSDPHSAMGPDRADEAAYAAPAPRRRGRPPRSAQPTTQTSGEFVDTGDVAPKPARRRGRPAKTKPQDDGENAEF